MKTAIYGSIILIIVLSCWEFCRASSSDPEERWQGMNISQIDETFDKIEPGSYMFSEAEKYFDSVLERCPGSDDCLSAYYGKGRVLNDDKEDYKGGFEYLDRALEIDPSCCQCLDQMGWSLFSLEDYDGAMRMVEDAIKMCPSDAHAWNNKGIYYYLHFQDYQKALECFNKAIEVDPEFGDAWWDKYKAHLKLGQKDDANAALAKATEYGTSEQSTEQEK
jgi:tetratricopeptide (TPR) repeat protein